MCLNGHVLLITKFILTISNTFGYLNHGSVGYQHQINQLFSNKLTTTFLIHVSFSNSCTKILNYLVQAGCHDNHDIIQKSTINLTALVQEGRNCIIILTTRPFHCMEINHVYFAFVLKKLVFHLPLIMPQSAHVFFLMAQNQRQSHMLVL